MSIEKEFVPYEQALALKELGFNEPCVAIFNINNELNIDDGFYKQEEYHKDTVLAPTFSQAFRWFREKYKIDFSIITNYAKVDSKMIKSYRVGFIIVKNNIIDSYFLRPENNKLKFIEFNTFEEAELECLKKLIEIVKQ